MKIRLASMQDLEKITELEAMCFPPEEAASRDSFQKRLDIFPNHFWLLEEENGREKHLLW